MTKPEVRGCHNQPREWPPWQGQEPFLLSDHNTTAPAGPSPRHPRKTGVSLKATRNYKKGFFAPVQALGGSPGLFQPHLEQPAFFVDSFPVLISRRCFNLHRFIADAADWKSWLENELQDFCHRRASEKGIIGSQKRPGAGGARRSDV